MWRSGEGFLEEVGDPQAETFRGEGVTAQRSGERGF